MAIDDADRPDSPELTAGSVQSTGGTAGVAVGAYTWIDFLRERGHTQAAETIAGQGAAGPGEYDWAAVEFDPSDVLGFHPDAIEGRFAAAAANAEPYFDRYIDFLDAESSSVTKGQYSWDQFKAEYYLDESGNPPLDKDGSVKPFRPDEWLGFDPEHTEAVLAIAGDVADEIESIVDTRTVNVNEELDEDEFFSTPTGEQTITTRYDLEKTVPAEKKHHFSELDRYWVNKPYAFVIIFHSEKENETKYYVVEPYLNPIEADLQEFLTGKLRDAIKYSDDEVVTTGDESDRRAVIERETRRLLDRYDLHETEGTGVFEQVTGLFSRGKDQRTNGESGGDRDAGDTDDGGDGGLLAPLTGLFSSDTETEKSMDELQPRAGSIRPEPTILAEDPNTVTTSQVVKLLYYLKRNFIGYERIDPIKHDINVEDISCDGYNSPVFVYHTDYEQIISNVYHGESRLDDFVVKLAQRSGKGISKRRPQVDATLPDGSRAQLTLGREVSDHGTNYTIRQFKDVPFTPIDLINWNTFSLEEMAFLWLCIENNKSLIFAGGTASGKTTSLNAVSLFIPSNAKIVSIEDTREVELPQRNWIASVTRPSFTDDDKGDVDEFELLEAALRQRPDYIVMGEIRGEEGRTLFQVMSTGHTTYTTFHADTVGEVLKRFTTDPINVSKTMFTALDLVSVQTSTRVQGNKVRRNKVLTEINHYDPENDEINVKDVYQWQAETDEFLKMGESNTLEEIKFDRGWGQHRLETEVFKRKVVLAYLIVNGLNEYRQVAATLQAFINDPDTIMALIATDRLEVSLEDLRTMESVLIDVDPEKEALVPRPDPDAETLELAEAILEHAEEELFGEYRDAAADSEDLTTALASIEEEEDVEATPSTDPVPAFPEAEDAAGESDGSVSGAPTESGSRSGAESVDPGTAGGTAGESTEASRADSGDDAHEWAAEVFDGGDGDGAEWKEIEFGFEPEAADEADGDGDAGGGDEDAEVQSDSSREFGEFGEFESVVFEDEASGADGTAGSDARRAGDEEG